MQSYIIINDNNSFDITAVHNANHLGSIRTTYGPPVTVCLSVTATRVKTNDHKNYAAIILNTDHMVLHYYIYYYYYYYYLQSSL